MVRPRRNVKFKVNLNQGCNIATSGLFCSPEFKGVLGSGINISMIATTHDGSDAVTEAGRKRKLVCCEGTMRKNERFDSETESGTSKAEEEDPSSQWQINV